LSAGASAKPRITVIIPCFNDGDLIRETVESVREDEPLEQLIVDDASTDPATKVVLDELEEEGLSVVHRERNGGVLEARMTGLECTSAPYVFPLDSDDLAVPGALGRMADLLDANPEAVVCFGDYAEFGDAELIRAVPGQIDPFRVAYANELAVSSMFRRSLLEELGGWRADGFSERSHEDWNLWMAVAERGYKGVHLGPGDLVYRRRMHTGRLLSTNRDQHPKLYKTLKTTHPRLFADLPRHRRESEMPVRRKLLYPLVYGGRRRFAFESKLKAMLDRAGVWTLKR
jgi:glycosyltransferase involved in cell wall biosynthesis